MNAEDIFDHRDREKIKRAIELAEDKTSGEICIHIEDECPGDVLDRAADLFHILGIDQTKLRNGVLFYMAVRDRKFAILGDAGINAVVPSNFWDGVRDLMREAFREGKFEEGLENAIHLAGDQLKIHFPVSSRDVNELPDDITFG